MTDRAETQMSFAAAGSSVPAPATAPDGTGENAVMRRLVLLRVAGRILALVAAGIGVLVLYGWARDIDALKSVLPGLVAMKANTATGFVLSGAAVWLLMPAQPGAVANAAARILSLIVALLGAATLFEIVTKIDLGIDGLVFVEAPGAIATSSPGRMAPTSAVAFMAIGTALLALGVDTTAARWWTQVLGLIAAILGLISVTGYFFGASELYGVFLGPLSHMALHTAVAFLLLGVAVLIARPESAIAADFSGAGSGSLMARSILPAILGVPILLAWLFMRGEDAGLYDADTRLALYASANVIVFSILVWLNARRMNREYERRSFAEAQLRELNDELEQRVAERTRTLESQSAQLRQSQKMEAIGNLTGGMAHDFNNLLGVVIGNLDLLRERTGEEPEIDELAREALDAAMRGADLTQRLLAFARLQPLQPEQIDLNQTVERISKLLRRTLGADVEMTVMLGESIWPIVADPAQLEAALVNIVNNARDAMPRGGSLTIATENRQLDADYVSQYPGLEAGDYALIKVSDTGTGMTPEVVAQVFEPFFTTKEQGKGTGLGLSMVFGFMKQSGGHINVYSEPGVGTTFRLYLPQAVAIGEEAAAEPVIPEPGGRETVLVVEDNAGLRKIAVRQLTELGYHTFEAEDGPSALRVLETEMVDMLFTDIVMPGGLSGYDLARLALERWPRMKAVLTSGFPDVKLNGGGPPVNLRLLTKPYRKAELAHTLRDVLDS